MALDATALTLLALGVVVVLAAVADRWAGGRLHGVRGAVAGTVVVGVLLAAAGGVFALVASDEALEDADAPVLGWVLAHRGPGLNTAAEVVSLVGGTTVTAGLALVAAVLLFVRGRRGAAVIWVLGVGVGSLTIRLVKSAVERPRPPAPDRLTVETSASLPSGHALMAALGLGLLAATVVLLTAGHLRRRAARWSAIALAVVLALLIGASRVYLGVHWSTDVAAGWLIGAALALACATGARVLEARRGPAAPRSAAPPAPTVSGP